MSASLGFDRFHPLLGAMPTRAIPVADWVRVHARMPMSGEEMRRRAAAVWRTIDGETDSPRRETQAKAHRLYSVGRDIQCAHSLKAKLTTVHLIIQYLMAVIVRSYGLGVAR